MLDALQFFVSLMQKYAPALVDNPLPLFIVATFILANGVLYALTRGKEFPIVAYSSLLFLVPFLRLV